MKLNRKGFTLIELLAIIVILAIIMVVTIPTVLNSMDSAKEKQLQNAVDSVADWVQKQYDLTYMGTLGGDVNSLYTTAITGKTSIVGEDNKVNMESTLIEAAGIADAVNNIESGYFYYNNSKNRICVSLTAKSGGSFYVAGKETKTSSGC